MKILLLINWKIKYCDEIPDGIQPSDYSCPKETFWFFKYFNEEPQVDVVDISAPEIIEKIESNEREFQESRRFKEATFGDIARIKRK